MRFKSFIENLWGTTPSPNPPSQPYWLKGSSGSMAGGTSPMMGAGPSPAMPMPQQGQPQKKMMKKKMKKD